MDSIFSFLLIPLIAGYVFCLSVPSLYVKIRDQSSHHLIMTLVITAFLLLLLSNFIYIAIYPPLIKFCSTGALICEPFFTLQKFSRFFSDALIAQIPHGDNVAALNMAFLSLLLAVLSYCYTQARLRDMHPQKLSRIWREAGRDDFQNKGGILAKLILNCFKHGRPVIITLKSRKVYVGYVSGLPEIGEAENWQLKLLPLRSGYRTPDELRVDLDNDYGLFLSVIRNFPSLKKGQPIQMGQTLVRYEQAENLANHFGILVNWRDIESASVWIPELYQSLGPVQPLHAPLPPIVPPATAPGPKKTRARP